MNVRSILLGNNNDQYFIRNNHSCTDGKKFSFACWFKLSSTDSSRHSFAEIGEKNFYIDNGHLHFSANQTDLQSVEQITDTTDWHHALLAVDSNQVTAQQRVKIYLDGVEITYSGNWPGQGTKVLSTSGSNWRVGTSIGQFNGKLDELHFVESQLQPSDLITGTPGAPKDFAGAFGAKGFRLNFDNFAGVANLGYDTSGNGFNFTPHAITVPANSSTDIPQTVLAANDLVVGSPVLDQPELEVFTLKAVDLVVGSPVVDPTPSLTVIGVNTVEAVDLTVSNPELGEPPCLSFRDGNLGAGWTMTSTRIGLGFIDSVGGWDAAALLETPATGPFEVSQTIAKSERQQIFRVVFDVAPTASRRLIEIGLGDGQTSFASAIFDPRNGECRRRTSSIDFHLLGVEADVVRFGYYRFMVVAETNDATTLKAYIRLVDESLNTNYVSDGTGNVLIADPMLLEGTDARDFRWEIGPPEMRFYWTVHLTSLGLRWFRCGQGACGVDPHLMIITAPDLDCVLRRWQPAQDHLVFDYSGMVVAGSGDPMAGTP